jgi:hypothetical protein
MTQIAMYTKRVVGCGRWSQLQTSNVQRVTKNRKQKRFHSIFTIILSLNSNSSGSFTIALRKMPINPCKEKEGFVQGDSMREPLLCGQAHLWMTCKDILHVFAIKQIFGKFEGNLTGIDGIGWCSLLERMQTGYLLLGICL